MIFPRKTPIVAKELGVTYNRIINLIRFGKIPSPHRDSSFDFAWTDQDVENARQAILLIDRNRNRKAVAV